MRSRLVLALAGTSMVLLAAACSKPPTMEIQQADRALEEAKVAEAAKYAPESLKAAQDARNRLDVELTTQEGRFAMMRNYDKAIELAAASQTAAEKAKRDGIEGRNKAKEEAAQLIAEVRSTLAEVRDLLEQAPKGKGTQVDIAMLKSDLDGIERMLPEMDSAFAADRFLETQSKAKAAKTTAEEVRQEVLRAMETKKRLAHRT